jgi:hypothetical protein
MDNPPEPSLSRLSFLAGFGFGAFIGGALALFAIALLQEREGDPVIVYEQAQQQPLPTATAEPSATPVLRSASLPTTLSAIDVRVGPGDGYAIVGLIGSGEEVEPVGRSDDLEWVAVRFPPGSVALGWLPVSELSGAIGLDGLSVVFPTPLPRTIGGFPTATLGIGTAGTPPAEGTVTVTPTPSASAGLPDLVVTTLMVSSDRRLNALISNVGEGELTGFAIFVQFRNLGDKVEMVRLDLESLPPGNSIVVQSDSFRLEGEETVQVAVDPMGAIPESDESNNLLQLVLEPPPVGAPTPVS